MGSVRGLGVDIASLSHGFQWRGLWAGRASSASCQGIRHIGRAWLSGWSLVAVTLQTRGQGLACSLGGGAKTTGLVPKYWEGPRADRGVRLREWLGRG